MTEELKIAIQHHKTGDLEPAEGRGVDPGVVRDARTAASQDTAGEARTRASPVFFVLRAGG